MMMQVLLTVWATLQAPAVNPMRASAEQLTTKASNETSIGSASAVGRNRVSTQGMRTAPFLSEPTLLVGQLDRLAAVAHSQLALRFFQVTAHRLLADR